MTTDTLRTRAIWSVCAGLFAILVGGILGAIGAWDGIAGLSTLGLIVMLNGGVSLGFGGLYEHLRIIVKKQDERLAALELRVGDNLPDAHSPAFKKTPPSATE